MLTLHPNNVLVHSNVQKLHISSSVMPAVLSVSGSGTPYADSGGVQSLSTSSQTFSEGEEVIGALLLADVDSGCFRLALMLHLISLIHWSR